MVFKNLSEVDPIIWTVPLGVNFHDISQPLAV